MFIKGLIELAINRLGLLNRKNQNFYTTLNTKHKIIKFSIIKYLERIKYIRNVLLFYVLIYNLK